MVIRTINLSFNYGPIMMKRKKRVSLVNIMIVVILLLARKILDQIWSMKQDAVTTTLWNRCSQQPSP
jgi:hypothetical protein